MTYQEVVALLKENRDERGIAHWQKLRPADGMKGFGIGLTKLRAIAKKIGRDHALALKLWDSDIYEAKVIGALIDEPSKLTREQVERQVRTANFSMLSYVFCSRDATLPKATFVRDLAIEWMGSKDHVRRRCGYLLLYGLGKNTKDRALTDEFFEGWIGRIEKTIQKEENYVKDAMNGSLLSVGQRNTRLNRRAIAAARAYGPIEVDYGDNSCKAPDIVRHLTSDRLKKKLGVK